MRILVVDDHELIRKGIRSVLAAEPALTICGEAVDGQDAVEKARDLSPDVVVMDISMPRLNGLEAAREIKRFLPHTEIVIVSQHVAPEMVRQAFSAGAGGYVVKSNISTNLLEAIRKVTRHETFVPAVGAAPASENLDPQEILQRSAAFEKALRESEERFRSAMNNMAEGLYTVDAQGLATYINPSAERMFGRGSGELLGKHVHAATHNKHPDGTDFPAAECLLMQTLQTGTELREHEDIFIRKDGAFFPIIFSVSPLKVEGTVVGAVISFRDDTTRRHTQEALRRSERIYRTIGESIDYGVWICDAGGRNLYASPSFLKLLGLTQEQCSEFGWTHVLDSQDAEAAVAAWKDCVREGTFWELEHRFRGADGNWHSILARGEPIRDSQGNILYWAGINLDIQHLKNAQDQLRAVVQTLEARIAERTRELESATEQLRELSGKLLQTQDEERRRIARELHDGVGQLLAALSMNLSKLAHERAKLSPEACQSLDENADLIKEASQELRSMSHLLHPPLLDEIGLESAIRWYVEGFAQRSKITVRLQLVPGFSAELPRDLALSLFRIVQECLTNVHRHSGSPTALVRIDRSSEEITLEVKDRGRGIPLELQAGISSGGSSGLGMRGMRERIRQFGGRLEIRSDPKGTRIVAVLPLPELEEENAGESQDEGLEIASANMEKLGPNIATILCIDDELTGMLPRKLLLESAGYRVIEARSGADGIRLFQSEKVDAVILDYWMSGMKGTAVATELKRIDPAVPIIVLSGMSDLPGEASGLVDEWIVKGSTKAEQLLDSINALLERRPT